MQQKYTYQINSLHYCICYTLKCHYTWRDLHILQARAAQTHFLVVGEGYNVQLYNSVTQVTW